MEILDDLRAVVKDQPEQTLHSTGKTSVNDQADRNHEEEEFEDEIVIRIEPHAEELEALGVSLEEFESALTTTLDAYDRTVEAADDPDEITALDDAEIILGGKVYPLCAVADIFIASDSALLEDQNEDDGAEGPDEPDS
jgi:hypothetical protein